MDPGAYPMYVLVNNCPQQVPVGPPGGAGGLAGQGEEGERGGAPRCFAKGGQ